jgi:hypothetical protein
MTLVRVKHESIKQIIVLFVIQVWARDFVLQIYQKGAENLE